MLSLVDYRFLKTIHENLIENRNHFYIFNQCITEANAPWVPSGNAYIAYPKPEALKSYKDRPFKRLPSGKKIARRKPREGFQGVLLGGIDNAKVAKGWKKGYISLVLNLSPAEESGFNLCSCRTKGCALACLHMSGSHVFQKVKMKSRLGNTFYLVKQREKFLQQLTKEISIAKEHADSTGKKLAIRLNGTSDLPWESPDFGINGKSIMDMFPDVQFYDYTKVPNRIRKFSNKDMPNNYHLTFSYSERPDSAKNSIEALEAGSNVAIVFGPGKSGTRENLLAPKVWNGFKVVNGDESDLRFEDEEGVVVGLTAKADAAWDFDRLSPTQLDQINKVIINAGVTNITTKNGMTKEAIKILQNPEIVYKVIDIIRHGEKHNEKRGSGFVVPPEDESVDPRKYPDNLPYVIQGIQKKLSRAFRGKDSWDSYRKIRQDFFSKHGDMYNDYLKKIEQYCKEHPEECKDTNTKGMPLAKPDNPLSQAGIGIKQPQLVQIGILPKDRK